MAGSPFNALTATRHAELLRRVLGEDIRHESVSPELMIAHVLEIDRPEWHHPAGSTIWGVRIGVAAVAAVFGHAGIRNPAGSGMLCTVTGVSGSNNTGAAIIYNVRASSVPTALASTAGVWFKDTRRLRVGPAGPILGIADTNAASLGTGPIETLTLGVNVTQQFLTPPYVLSPGGELYVVGNIVNSVVDATFEGYFRPAKVEELIQ